MMNYEIFKEVVKEKIKDYLPPKYENAEVNIHSANKVNQVKDGLTVQLPESNVAPTIYLNDLYAEYKETENLQGIMVKTAKMFDEAISRTGEINTDISAENMKEKIVFQLINTEQNKEMLAGMPHREFQDLSIIYRAVMKVEKEGIQSVMITNPIAASMGLTEEQMFKLAAENTRNIFPPRVRSMNEIMREMFERDGMPPEIAEMMIGEMPPNETMWVIGNEQGINGAISMMYEDQLHKLAENLETDLYIMPSSIHEVIAVSSDMGDPNELAAMVAEINMDQVALEERLSNQVYHYDKDLRKLSLATDTPNKRLDGLVAEPKLIYEAKEQSR